MDKVFVSYSKQDLFFAAASKESASGSGHTQGLKITKLEKAPSRADCIVQAYWDICIGVLHFDTIWCEKDDLS